MEFERESLHETFPGIHGRLHHDQKDRWLVPANTKEVERMSKASFTELFEQGDITATAYMRNARENIDKEFGKGYAAEHPELVAAYMNAAVKDLGNSYTLKVAQGIARTAFNHIDDLTETVDRLAAAQEKVAEAHEKIEQ